MLHQPLSRLQSSLANSFVVSCVCIYGAQKMRNIYSTFLRLVNSRNTYLFRSRYLFTTSCAVWIFKCRKNGHNISYLKQFFTTHESVYSYRYLHNIAFASSYHGICFFIYVRQCVCVPKAFRSLDHCTVDPPALVNIGSYPNLLNSVFYNMYFDA